MGSGEELGIEGLRDLTTVGSGGSSTVYRAFQPALNRAVAVKVIHQAWSSETQDRVERERTMMGQLSGHSAVVPILDAGITRRGEPYLLLPYYQRGSLSRLVADRGPLPWTEAAFLIEQAAEALADCHRAGIVHRDIKPGNILLTDGMRPRLTDFGIALPLGETTTEATLAYSPVYSAPETYRPGVVAPSADVYGLGATLWTLLEGAPPTDLASSPDNDSALPPTTAPLPTALARLLEATLHPDPARRPTDAAILAARMRDMAAPRRDVAARMQDTAAPMRDVAAPAGSPPDADSAGRARTGPGIWLSVAAVVVGLGLIAVAVLSLR